MKIHTYQYWYILLYIVEFFLFWSSNIQYSYVTFDSINLSYNECIFGIFKYYECFVVVWKIMGKEFS